VSNLRKGNFILCLLLIFNCGSFSQTIDQNIYKEKLIEFERNIADIMTIDKSPGIAIACVKGNFIWSKGFGNLNIENVNKITSESLFRNTTLLRSMIVFSVLQLQEEGKINLSNTLQSYILQSESSQKLLTLKNILCLVGPTFLGGIQLNYYQGSLTTSELSKHEIDSLYSDLVLLIEKISGKNYEDYLKQNIWDPLLMNDTQIEDKRKIIKNRVSTYVLNKGKINNDLQNENLLTNTGLQLRINVNDMIKFGYGIISNKLFNNTDIKSLFEQDDNNVNQAYLQLGWPSQVINGRFCFSFNHVQNDDNSLLVVFPRDTLIIAMASNLKDANLKAYFFRLYQLLMNEHFNLKPYFSNIREKEIFELLDKVFNLGLYEYLMYGEESLKNPVDFSYLNKKIVEIDDKENIYNESDLEIKNSILKNIGCYISSKLIDNKRTESIEDYHKYGTIYFFNNYINTYKNNTEWLVNNKLNAKFENIIARWFEDWKIAFNENINNFYLNPLDNFYGKIAKMKSLFEEKTVYPNLSEEISLAIDQSAKLNRIDMVYDLGSLGLKLYEKSPGIYYSYGIGYAWLKDPEVTQEMLRRVKKHFPFLTLPVDNFLEKADEFKHWGKIREIIGFLEAVIHFEKSNPKLYSYLGDIYLDFKQEKKAVQNYKKSIEIDPMFEYAKIKLDSLNVKY